MAADIEKTTLTAGLALFQMQNVGQWTLVMVASPISVAPIVIAFFLSHRQVLEGVSMTEFKW